MPIIASRIPGNVGLLGETYPGYYAVADEIGLAELLARAESDPAYLASLATGVSAQRVLIDAKTPGVWAFHCHILPHVEGTNGMFGMVNTLIVVPEKAHVDAIVTALLA